MNQLYELVNNKCTFDNIISFCAKRISEAYTIPIEKIKLTEASQIDVEPRPISLQTIWATRNLLRYEDREIEAILK